MRTSSKSRLRRLALALLLFGGLSFGCAGSHVSVGVGVAGPYYGYGPYGAPPVWVGRPYPGNW